MIKWKQRDSYPQPLSPQTNTQSISQTGQFGWVFVYELSGGGFESRCCHLNFRYGGCFKQGVAWHSGKL